MKKAIKEYGSFVLEAVIVTALLLLIFRLLPAGNGTYGVGNALGGKTESAAVDYSGYTDAAAVGEVLGRAKPSVAFSPCDAVGRNRPIVAGKEVALAGYFQCTDAEGAVLTDVKIESIQDASGRELLRDALLPADTFRFPAAGAYDVKVTATDGKNQCGTGRFHVPVVAGVQEGA